MYHNIFDFLIIHEPESFLSMPPKETHLYLKKKKCFLMWLHNLAPRAADNVKF